MTRRRRTILLAALALAAPLPAFALSGETATAPEPTVADLGVSASLDSCGLLETQIVCQLSVSWNTLENATSYTASVTSPDGSVTDFGSVPAGGTSLTVPYEGNGNYGVRVTAYGEPEQPGGEKPVIATESSRDLSEPGSDDPRVKAAPAPVKPDATPRHAPSLDTPADPGPVETAPTCATEPPATEPVPGAETPPDATTPDTAASPTPIDPAAASTEPSGRAAAATTVEDQANDPTAADAQSDPNACPAPPAP